METLKIRQIKINNYDQPDWVKVILELVRKRRAERRNYATNKN